MNAPNTKTVAGPGADARITTDPLPASRKVYVEGSLHADVRVPFREIALTPTRAGRGTSVGSGVANDPLRVYDTSGPYTDPSACIDVRRGLDALRAPWIERRGDTEFIEGRRAVPNDDGYADAAQAAAVERIAREQLGLVRKNEVVFQFEKK